MINRIRFWLIGLLFNEGEKYLIKRAIDDRINRLEYIAVNERWANKEDIQTDVKDYENIKSIFSTDSWL